MRLIDADELKKCYEGKTSNKADYLSIRKMIDNMPTTYDIEKVRADAEEDAENRFNRILDDEKRLSYEQGRADAIDKCAVAFNELAVKWFNQGCIALGDIPRIAEELKEQK